MANDDSTVRDRPNVLWLVADQHRPGWLGAAGHPVRTPNVDALADRGVRFTNAFSPAPVCAASRACLATGLSYDRSPVPGNGTDLPPSTTTVYERLRDEAGYHVMGCGKFDLHKASYAWGVDGQHRLRDWGFTAGVDNAGKIDAVLALVTDEHPRNVDSDRNLWAEIAGALDAEALEPRDPYGAFLADEGLLADHVRDFLRRRHAEDKPATFPTPLPAHAYCDNWIGRQGLTLLSDAPAAEPWFLQVNFAGPHSPWDVTEDMHEWYRDPPVDLGSPAGEGGPPPEASDAVRRNYAAMIENIDRWVGRYIDRLRDRDELADTVIVFTADHGEMLGDHGRWGKSVPYCASSGIPLVVAGPEVKARDPVDAPVSLLDLHATALSDAGLSIDGTDARPLRTVLAGGAPPREVVIAALYDWRLATDGRFSVVSGFDFGDDLRGDWSDPVLFDRLSDPGETRSVADAHPAVVNDLRDALDR